MDSENRERDIFEEDVLTGREEGNVVDTEIEKCDACGSNLVFDPDEQALLCPHCGSKKQFGVNENASELELVDALSVGDSWKLGETNVFSCDNCGAKVLLATNESAKKCPFCGTAHVTKIEELAGLKPNGLIPFAFGQDRAIEFSKAWAKKKLFAPSKFKKNIDADNVNGVYVPCFTFDSHTVSRYHGRIGKTHTRIVGSGKNRRTQTYIVWRNISGTFYHSYDDILVTAGSKLDQQKLDKISPYQTNTGKRYEEEYLLGFMAYHYDSEISDCWGDAKKRIDADLKNRILSQYFYDTVAYLNVSTNHENVTYKYVMLPVYVGNFNYNKKLYNFYVNGESGKVSGKTPKSPLRIGSAVTAGLAILAGIGFLIYKFFVG